MKKLIPGMFLITFFLMTSSFDTVEVLPNIPVLQTFQQQFKNASNIIWSETEEVVTAIFSLNHSRIQAFFKPDGTLLGTERDIMFTELPLLSMIALTNRFDNSNFYDLIAYTIGSDIYYVLTVETQTRKMEVKVLPSGELSVRKNKKDRHPLATLIALNK
jgi:hypothetical protein